ncbi:MAG TPA: hypothetical protein VN794_18675 [Methylomirabilota bacterium]|nr:hypothetical protein [Methylomirabilota bacterium]
MMLFGWTVEQWSIALSWYEKCHRKTLNDSQLTKQEALKILNFWGETRNVAPGEIKLIDIQASPLDEKRALQSGSRLVSNVIAEMHVEPYLDPTSPE